MQKWKKALGTLAIGAVTVSPFVADVAFAGAEKKTAKSDTPPTPTASEIETGQLLIKTRPVAKSSTGGPTPTPTPTASEIETGQLLIKDRPVAKSGTNTEGANAADNDLCGKPYTMPCITDASTAKDTSEIETEQMVIKDKPAGAAATENDLCGKPYTMPCITDATKAKDISDKVKPGLKGGSVIVALLSSAAAIGALVAFSGGNDGPTSP